MAIIPVHSMRDQPDYLGTLQRGMAFGSQMRQQREAEQRRNRLAEIGSQAYGAQGQARKDLIGQAVGVDMGQGLALGEALRQNDQAQMSAEDAQAKRIRGAAKYMMQAIETNDPNKIAGAHNAVRSFMGQFGQPFPEQFTPDMVPKIQEVLARTAYLEQGAEGTAVQSRFIDDQGNMVALMRDGSTRVVGKADPNIQIIEGQDGFYRVGRRGDGMNATPVQLGGGAQVPAQPMPTQGTMEADIAMANEMIRAGIPESQVTAFLEGRAARANQQTAGVQAMPQTGRQLRPRDPVQDAISKRMAEAQIEAQTAAEIERAKIYGRQSGEAQANAQFGSDEARKAAREASTKLPQLQNAVRGLGRIRTALEGVSSSGLGLVDSGPLDQFVARYTPAGRELEAAVGGIQNSVLALTRVPGVGAQSDLEARVAALQYPSLDNPPEVNARTLQNLEAFLQDLQAAYENVIASGNRQPAPADYQQPRAAPQQAPAAGPRRLKYNPQTGRIE